MLKFRRRNRRGFVSIVIKKYEPGHDCRKKKLFMIIGEDNDVTGHTTEEVAIEWEDDCAEKSGKEFQEDAKVSIHAMAGIKGPCTLKVHGKIKGKTVNILIDSGSTHNFIS